MILTVSTNIDALITANALNRGLYFRPAPERAVISGAGIAGLTTAFELLAKGYNVVIAEKRPRFTRTNVINLSVEVQAFLKRFNLLEKFEARVATRIKEHRCIVIEKNSRRDLGTSDVSQVHLDPYTSFELADFGKLFQYEGIYSVSIQELQTFLAEEALNAGAHLLVNVNVDVLKRSEAGGVAKLQIKGHDRVVVQPALFFIAEGAHSTSAEKLGMATTVVNNACTGENWVFGNVGYSGTETFVISMIDTSQTTLQIANVIFNAKNKVANVAVTSERHLSEATIKKRIQQTAQCAFGLDGNSAKPKIISSVKEPVMVTNHVAVDFCIGNVFRVGDSAGNSSPLAGLGGTLGLTLAPHTVRQLLADRAHQPALMHHNFTALSRGYTSLWFEKSARIKRFCQSTFAARG